MAENDLKQRVLSHLPRGKENAITGKQLAIKCGEYYTHYADGSDEVTTHTRGIRLAIQELIADGHPICSSTKTPAGYFIAESREEVNENLKVLKYGYGREIFRHYKYLAHARNAMFPQLGLKI